MIDHLVVTAPTLAAGVEYVRRSLGVAMEVGGSHPRMGTHNALLGLGPSTYLEVLAIDPSAPAPDRPRWFGLDACVEPRLSAWVARVDDIASVSAPGGDVSEMTRGTRRWLITIPRDGRMPWDGVAPAWIQWLSEPHPALTLRDSGCALVALRGFHPDADGLRAALPEHFFDPRWVLASIPAGEPPALVADFHTPGGPRRLGA
ncbi:MAG TPA: VOC family protein [Candidatus Krumholzibacteria bacterium]